MSSQTYQSVRTLMNGSGGLQKDLTNLSNLKTLSSIPLLYSIGMYQSMGLAPNIGGGFYNKITGGRMNRGVNRNVRRINKTETGKEQRASIAIVKIIRICSRRRRRR